MRLIKVAEKDSIQFSPELEDEIEYLSNLIETESDADVNSRASVVREIIEDADDPGHWANKFKKELTEFAIKIGIYQEVTKEQLKNMMVSRGTKYDLKHKGKYYIFESWDPLFKMYGGE